MAKTEARESEDFYNVLADGKFHITVPEGTDGAVLRKYETSTGEEGEKWEKVYQDLSGTITKVDMFEGKYGKNILLSMKDDDGEFVVSLGTSSNFGEDMLKKLLNIDLTKEVKLAPYSFIDETTKKAKKGVTVTQDGVKIHSYFHSYDAETKKTKEIKGYPVAPKAKANKVISSDEWKMYFMQARLFMIGVLEEKFQIGVPETSGTDLTTF